MQRENRKKFPLPFGKPAGCPWRAGEKKFLKIPAYSGLCGVVRNEGEFLQINVHFPFCWFVGISERNIAAALAKFPLAALKVLREAHAREAATFLEQDSTTVPNLANRSFCPMGILLGLPPQTRLLRLAPLEKIYPRKEVHSHEKIQHAPPPPGNQDTLDRGRIRRVFRACHPLQNEPVSSPVPETTDTTYPRISNPTRGNILVFIMKKIIISFQAHKMTIAQPGKFP